MSDQDERLLEDVTPENLEDTEARSKAADEEARLQVMMNAALVLGFNEMAARAQTLGDKVYFRLFRDEIHKKLQAAPNNYGFVITFAAAPPDPPTTG